MSIDFFRYKYIQIDFNNFKFANTIFNTFIIINKYNLSELKRYYDY